MLLFLPIIGALAGTAAAVASTYATIKSTKSVAGFTTSWTYTPQTAAQRDELIKLQQELDILAIQTGQPSYNYVKEVEEGLLQYGIQNRFKTFEVRDPNIYGQRIERIKAHIAELKKILAAKQQAEQQQQQQQTQLTQQLQSVPVWIWVAGGILLLLIAKK